MCGGVSAARRLMSEDSKSSPIHLRSAVYSCESQSNWTKYCPSVAAVKCVVCTKEQLHCCCAGALRKHVSKHERGMWCSCVSEIRGLLDVAVPFTALRVPASLLAQNTFVHPTD